MSTQTITLNQLENHLWEALFKYTLHADAELFEKAFSYIKQYY